MRSKLHGVFCPLFIVAAVAGGCKSTDSNAGNAPGGESHDSDHIRPAVSGQCCSES
jgi:hypothetical protein